MKTIEFKHHDYKIISEIISNFGGTSNAIVIDQSKKNTNTAKVIPLKTKDYNEVANKDMARKCSSINKKQVSNLSTLYHGDFAIDHALLLYNFCS